MTRQDPPRPCARCASSVEPEDLRCPVCYLAIRSSLARPDMAVRVEVLRCQTCGAGMEYRAEVQALRCGFCGGVVRQEEEEDPLEQADRCLPFTVPREEAVTAYRNWITSLGFFHPSDLVSASRLQSLRALWWVGWVFDADAEVTWTADSDAGARRARWAPHAGEFRVAFDDVIIPATHGLSAAECARLSPTYVLGKGADPSEIAGSEGVLERFELPRSSARARVVEAIQHLAHRQIKNRQLPGARARNIHAAIRLRGLATRRFAFPAYVLAYRYRDRLYRTVISGQDSRCVMGEAPRSMLKIVLVALAVLMGVGLTALLFSLAR